MRNDGTLAANELGADGKVKYTQLSEAEAQKLLDAFKEDSASGDA